MSPTSIFAPASTPASEIASLSALVIGVMAAIFICVATCLVFVLIAFRRRRGDNGAEPPQVYGSLQVELAWTVIPLLTVVVLFLAAARVVLGVQAPAPPPGALRVVAIGRQFWWEFRYPELGIVTANELHVPVSDPARPTPTFIELRSADTDHSFWVPRLGGKTDLIPNRVNTTWFDPSATGLYVGQCAQYCGTQHAKMLLRVYVDSREDFDRWVQSQRQPVEARDERHERDERDAVAEGRRVFESAACGNCHAIAGTTAAGRNGPDLTHLMSRETIGSGIVPNTVENLRAWIADPKSLKPGVRMPAMQLSDSELNAVTAYLASLR
jgi:cytochrome c oxidase subunit 2